MSQKKKLPVKRSPAETRAAPRTGLLVLGNQLFEPAHLAGHRIDHAFMREDVELCTYYRFHQQKIVFYLAAMRHHAMALRAAKIDVCYQTLSAAADSAAATEPYEAHLLAWLHRTGIERLLLFEIEDQFLARRILALLAAEGIAHEVLASPMFLTGRAAFVDYLGQVKRPFMKTFYERQRRRLDLLMGSDGRPLGGRWSFDEENRCALPADLELPKLAAPVHNPYVKEVIALVATRFPEHPGNGQQLWLPVDRAGALRWLSRFVRERLHQFGPYEDALSQRSAALFHGVLTPFLNVGLLTPQEVLQRALDEDAERPVPLNSLEGFVRQVIGWREFIRGIYHNFGERQTSSNFWGHSRQLSEAWYRGDTGIPPLDEVIDKVNRLGWANHIERLMVVGSLMLLLEVEPQAAHRWFMEMFIDSSDWVMGPNVYGMALFSDGGIFATKPYICGSNYYRKMGTYPKGDWCDGVDGLYWRFIARHAAFFTRNPRLSMMARSAARLDPVRRDRIYAAADRLQARLTSPAATDRLPAG